MTEIKETDKRQFQYFAPPKTNIRLSAYDQQILEIIKEFGAASINNILCKLMPDYNPIPTKLPSFKKRIRIVFTVQKVAVALIKLVKADCIRIS